MRDSTSGKKFDSGKHELHLNPPEFLEGAARAFGYGKGKYGEYNWMGGIKASRLYDACQRHLLAWFWGEETDPESGLSHLDHAAASLAMLMGTLKRREDLDDRPNGPSNPS